MLNEVLRVYKDNVALSEKLHNQAVFSHLSLDFDGYNAFELLLANISDEAILEIFTERHTEPWRLLRFLKNIRRKVKASACFDEKV